MRVYDLKQGIIYGLVRSRRLKSSMGINLSPTKIKLCSFNCQYCHYGFTNIVTDSYIGYEEHFPTPQDVETALTEALHTFTENPLYITFSGNGEPSMHPEFPEIVDRVIRVRDTHASSVKTAILTNSAKAHIPEIREAILKLDVPIMKLDAGDSETFRKVNRPAKGVDFNRLTAALAIMPNIIIQTCLLSGSISNSEDHQIDAWIEQISRIRPKEVQVYTVDRPPADSGLIPIPHDQMQAIVDRATAETDVSVVLYGPRENKTPDLK